MQTREERPRGEFVGGVDRRLRTPARGRSGSRGVGRKLPGQVLAAAGSGPPSRALGGHSCGRMEALHSCGAFRDRESGRLPGAEGSGVFLPGCRGDGSSRERKLASAPRPCDCVSCVCDCVFVFASVFSFLWGVYVVLIVL